MLHKQLVKGSALSISILLSSWHCISFSLPIQMLL